MKLVVLFSVFFLVITYAKSEEFVDVVYLKDSTVVRGQIFEKIPNESIRIKDADGRIFKIKYSGIIRITKEKIKQLSFLKKDYSEFGVSLGTPAGLNLNLVRWFSEYGVGLSGMYWGPFLGVQGNFKMKFSDNINRSHSLSLVAGIINMTTEEYRYSYYGDGMYERSLDWKYLGITYNLNYSGFWLEVGITAGQIQFEPEDEFGTYDVIIPQIVFQIGYVYRFIK